MWLNYQLVGMRTLSASYYEHGDSLGIKRITFPAFDGRIERGLTLCCPEAIKPVI